MRTALMLSLVTLSAAHADEPKGKAKAEPKAQTAAPAPPSAGRPLPPPLPKELATAELKSAKGEKLGDATLEETPHGVLITIELSSVPAGAHAFHIHSVGKCDPTPGDKGPFTSAGGHLNPGGKKHGLRSLEGAHEGDLPNLVVATDGKAKAQFIAGGATLKKGEKNSLFHEGGTALVLHAKEDDHASDPAGAAGDRIACGVIVEKK